jgi:hypothetical protein
MASNRCNQKTKKTTEKEEKCNGYVITSVGKNERKEIYVHTLNDRHIAQITNVKR